jgi:hypothetical protein
MQAVQDALNRTLESLPRLIRKEALDDHVANILASLDQQVAPETRKTQWEFVLRQEIFTLAVRATRAHLSQMTQRDFC